MAAPRRSWTTWIAGGLSYVMVVQLLLAGLALSAHAAPSGQAGLQAGICLSGAGTPAPVGDSAGHEASSTCCLPGCAMFAPAFIPPPTEWNAVPFRVAPGGPVGRAAFALPAMAHGRSPGLARAPPVLA